MKNFRKSGQDMQKKQCSSRGEFAAVNLGRDSIMSSRLVLPPIPKGPAYLVAQNCHYTEEQVLDSTCDVFQQNVEKRWQDPSELVLNDAEADTDIHENSSTKANPPKTRTRAEKGVQSARRGSVRVIQQFGGQHGKISSIPQNTSSDESGSASTLKKPAQLPRRPRLRPAVIWPIYTDDNEERPTTSCPTTREFSCDHQYSGGLSRSPGPHEKALPSVSGQHELRTTRDLQARELRSSVTMSKEVGHESSNEAGGCPDGGQTARRDRSRSCNVAKPAARKSKKKVEIVTEEETSLAKIDKEKTTKWGYSTVNKDKRRLTVSFHRNAVFQMPDPSTLATPGHSRYQVHNALEPVPVRLQRNAVCDVTDHAAAQRIKARVMFKRL